MHNKINFWDVQSSCCYVSRHQTLEFSLLEALEGDLPLLLRDVSMQYLRFLFKVCLEKDLIGFFLGLAEDDGASMPASVKVDNISDD